MAKKWHKQQTGMPHPNGLEQTAVPTRVDTKKWFAYSLIFVVFAVAVGIPQNNFGSLWIRPTVSSDAALFVTRLLVFAELCVMVYQWINATDNELTLWVRWLPKQPLERPEAFQAMFGLAVYLGLELALVPHVRLLTFAASALALLNYWTQWLANEHFVEALEFSRSEEDNLVRQDILDVLENYWVRRPQLGRIAMQIYFVGLSFTIAAIAAFEPEPQRAWYQAAAYGLLFLTILTTEITITLWRHERDRELKKLEAKLALQKAEHV